MPKSRSRQEINRAQRPLGPFPPLVDQVRTASLSSALSERVSSDPIWVFAYGSLIWRPCFTPSQIQRGRLRGYERRFSMWTVSARGTPESPGLGLGLEKAREERLREESSPAERSRDPSEAETTGGRSDATLCDGLLLEMPEATLLDDLETLWAREMLTGIYRPVWVEAEIETGTGAEYNTSVRAPARSALAFVVDPAHPQYAGRLNFGEQVRLIARAAGELGTCYEYLASTVRALRANGIADLALEALLAAVDKESGNESR